MVDAASVMAVKIDHFNKHMKDGFEDEKIKNCCCGCCCNGWTALNMLHDFVSDPDNQFPCHKALAKRVDQIQKFLKGDYRWQHLAESSKNDKHCIQHALACSCDSLCESCDHDHTNECVECNMAPILFLQLKAWAASLAEQSLKRI